MEKCRHVKHATDYNDIDLITHFVFHMHLHVWNITRDNMVIFDLTTGDNTCHWCSLLCRVLGPSKGIA